MSITKTIQQAIQHVQEDINASPDPISLKQHIIARSQQYLLETLQKIPLVGARSKQKKQVEEVLKSYGYKIINSPSMYTALPEGATKDACLSLAAAVSQNQPTPHLYALTLLLPMLDKETLSQNILEAEVSPNNLAAWLASLFATHISSRDGSTLISVQKLLDQEQMRCISEEERTRLQQHSELTYAIYAAEQQLTVLQSGAAAFRLQLQHLISVLASCTFSGTAEALSIRRLMHQVSQFNSYYLELHPDKQALIPSALQDKLKELTELTNHIQVGTSPSKQTINKLYSISYQLEKVSFSVYETIFYVRDTEHELAHAIQLAEVRLEKAKQALKEALDEEIYVGEDHLGNPYTALKAFGLTYRIAVPEDFSLLAQLSPSDIKALLQDTQNKGAVTAYLKQENGFVKVLKLAMEAPPKTIATFLKNMHQALSEADVLVYRRQYSHIFQDVSTEHVSAISEALLPDAIQRPDQLSDLLEYLFAFPAHQAAILMALVSKLPKLVNSTYLFNQVLRPLTPEQIIRVCHVISQDELEQSLLQDINSTFLCEAIQALTPEQISAMTLGLSTQILALFKKYWMLNTLSDNTQRQAVLAGIMTACSDGTIMLRDILALRVEPEELRLLLNARPDEALHQSITDGDELRAFLGCLQESDCKTHLVALQSRLPSLIQTQHHYFKLINLLTTAEEKAIVVVAMKEKLIDMTIGCRDLFDQSYFLFLFGLLNSAERAEVYPVLKPKLPQVLTRDDYSKFIEMLNFNQSLSFIRLMKAHWANIDDDFITLCFLLFMPAQKDSPELNPIQLSEMYDALKEPLLNIMQHEAYHQNDIDMEAVKENIKIINKLLPPACAYDFYQATKQKLFQGNNIEDIEAMEKAIPAPPRPQKTPHFFQDYLPESTPLVETQSEMNGVITAHSL